MRFDRLMFPLLYKRNKNIYSSSILTIIFLMIISVIIIFFDTQNLIKSSVVRNKVLNIMFLSKDFFSSSLPNFLKLKEHFISKKQLILENEILQKESKEYGLWELKAKRLEIENKILKKELSITPPKINKYVTAKIFVDTKSLFSKSILINVGKNMNVQIGQSAATSKGLVGSIVEVYDNYSRVLLITDINSKIPVRVGKKNIKAILSGKNKRELEFAYFQDNQIINENEIVFTSGDGGYFNSGIPIGTTRIENGKTYVIPTNNLEELQYLQIFLNNFKSF